MRLNSVVAVRSKERRLSPANACVTASLSSVKAMVERRAVGLLRQSLLVAVSVFIACISVSAGARCRPQEWQCPASEVCIPLNKICDQSGDCPNATDEGSSCSSSMCGVLSCSHRCHSTPTGGICSCSSGYEIDPSNNQTCRDYNECVEWGICDQLCQNQRGYYNCSCYPGYQLHTNGHTCNANTTFPITVYSIYEDGIWSYQNQPSSGPVITVNDAVAFDIHFDRQKVYWLDKQNRLFETSLNNDEQRQLVLSGIGNATAIAVDWIANNLYIVDAHGRQIHVLAIDSGYQTSIIDSLMSPVDVAIDPGCGLLFFIDQGDHSRTERQSPSIGTAYMDGSRRRDLFRPQDVITPRNLALDRLNRRIYFTEPQKNQISSIDYNGSDWRVILRSRTQTRFPVAISFFEDSVYFTDGILMAIKKTNAYASSNATVVALDNGVVNRQPLDIVVSHPLVQTKSRNACSNTTCEQMCVLTHMEDGSGVGFHCLCRTGFEVGDFLIHCRAIDTFLIYGSWNMVRGISLHPFWGRSAEAIEPIFGKGQSFVGIDFDANENYIYFSDILNGSIMRRKLNGTVSELILSRATRLIVGLALDWVSKNLYFTDKYFGCIGVVRLLSDQFRDVRLLIKNITNPHSIVMHPEVGLMFWTEVVRNQRQNSRIGRALGDGSNIAYIRTHELGWPFGLAIEPNRRRIWWCDALLDRIQNAAFDGSDVITFSQAGTRISHPFGLAIHDGFLYYSDMRLRAIIRTRLSNPLQQTTILNDHTYPYGLRIFNQSVQRINGRSLCSPLNNVCSNFCFPVLIQSRNIVSRHCGCPHGFSVNTTDQRTCVHDPSEESDLQGCPPNRFQCDNGLCVSLLFVCDGDNDCQDMSDERNCSISERTSCSPNEFKCHNNHCIPIGYVCDGYNDCRDNSDESSCSGRNCTSLEFQCSSGQCIPKSVTCDLAIQCEDGSDESLELCGNHTCSEYNFQCLNGRCVSVAYVCDGDNDCQDGSDEAGCPPRNCSSNQFRCQRGTCISSRLRCDMQPDCLDGSDEMNCPNRTEGNCFENEFRCAVSGTCIPSSYECDGHLDCVGGTDENSCAARTCSQTMFQCRNRRCIPQSFVCDGDNDCGDGSDEGNHQSCPPPRFQCSYGMWECPGNYRICINQTLVCDGVSHCPNGNDEGPFCNDDSCHISNGGCSHTCYQTPYGATCLCPHGMQLNDTKTCVDINECEPPGVCSQHCTDLKGGYKCSCEEGYVLLPNHRSCVVNSTVTPGFLFHEFDGSITKMSLTLSHMESLLGRDYNNYYWGYKVVFAVDMETESIFKNRRTYYPSYSYSIARIPFASREVIPLVTSGLIEVASIAVDWIGRNIYWSDQQLRQIAVASINGSAHAVLFKDNDFLPGVIVLDPRSGSRLMFWTTLRAIPKIERAFMDGSERMAIVTEKLSKPSCLAIDLPTRRLYFGDADFSYIKFCNYDGSGVQEVATSSQGVIIPTSIVVFEDYLYWMNSNNAYRFSTSCIRCTKYHCTNQTRSDSFSYSHHQDNSLVLHHPAIQPSESNPCATAQCSYLCLLSNSSSQTKCVCPPGMVLDATQHNCTNDLFTFFLAWVEADLKTLDISSENASHQSSLTISSLHYSRNTDFDYDSENALVYVVKNSGVYRVTLIGQNSSIFAPTALSQEPSSIAIDWMARNLYYSSDLSIGVIRIDGKENYHRLLLSFNQTPTSLVVHPKIGSLFWVDRLEMSIRKANLDGSEMSALINSGLNNPAYMTLDASQSVLYWNDIGTQKIEMYNFNTRRRTLIQANFYQPTGIAALFGNLYLADAGLELISVIGNDSILRPLHRNIRVSSLKIYYQRHFNKTNACSQSNGGCQQLCLMGTGNRPVCVCARGYVLVDDGKSCRRISSYLTVVRDYNIEGYSLTSLEEIMTPVSLRIGNRIQSLVVNIQTGLIYFSIRRFSVDSNEIFQVNLDGTGLSPLFDRISSSTESPLSGRRFYYFNHPQQGPTPHIPRDEGSSMTMDWLAGNLYFVTKVRELSYIEACRINGTLRLVILTFEGYYPVSLVVNPIERYLYWTYGERNPKILRSLLDGSNQTIIVDNGLRNPSSLAVDVMTGDLYWTDAIMDTIQAVSSSGGNRRIVYGNLPFPDSVSVFGSYLFWIDRRLSLIVRASKNASSPIWLQGSVRKQVLSVNYITVYDNSTQPQDSTNPCVMNNGGCAQLCFALPSSQMPNCQCATGTLSSDGKGCEDFSDYIIYCSSNMIGSQFFDASRIGRPFQQISAQGSTEFLDFNHANSLIFFRKRNDQKLYTLQLGSWEIRNISLPMETSFIYPQFSAIGNFKLLAYNWIARKLYFSDSNKLYLFDTDGSNVVTLMLHNGFTALVLDPCRGHMYFSSVHPGQISKASLSGRNIEILVNTSIQMPLGLAIDFESSQLYWTDEGRGTIECIGLNGLYRRTILESLIKPYRITVFSHHIYWTDNFLNSIFRAEKHTGANRQTLASHLSSHMDIKAYSSDAQPQCVNPCDNNNGGCSHICHMASQGAAVECSCPDTMNLHIGNGGKMCVPNANNCSVDHFVCSNGQCIWSRYVCDMDNDCGDGSDESATLCADRTCEPSSFVCRNGRCINPYYRCDFDNDCRDMSDEEGCPRPTCGPSQFECGNFRCIDAGEVCDGFDNCYDGNTTDELNCPPRTCASGYAKCANSNLCIHRNWLCDGDNDCGDNSDENPTFCSENTCGPGHFRCISTHRCIPASWHCDGDNDCGDSSDEPEDVCSQSNRTCFGNMFTCNNGRCVNPLFLCDGDNDCGDGSDESCENFSCSPDSFTCSSNGEVGRSSCISLAAVCDGFVDCTGGEDEQQNCTEATCRSSQFRCANGMCIHIEWVCDQDNDCGDLSDEPSNCTYPSCSSDQFTCSNHHCILRSSVCDTFDNCGDNSDEREELCLSVAPTCPGGQFRCNNGQCIGVNLVCNRSPDCADGTDEPRTCNINECETVEISQCSDNCRDTLTGYECYCNPGFTLMTNRKACRDIDECREVPGACTQICINMPGNHTCKCADGYQKSADEKTCKKLDEIEPVLVFSNQYYIRNLTTDGQYYGIITQGQHSVVSLDFDYIEQRLYFVDNSVQKIMRMFINGTGVETIVWHNILFADDLCVEWIGRKLYWGNSIDNKIFVSELNGTLQKSLVEGNLSSPGALAANPFLGFLYWTDWGLAPYIGRIGLDGSRRSIIINTRLGWPSALTIDHETHKIWWADDHLHYIEYSDADGQNRHTVFDGNVPHVFSLTIFEEWMYWTDWARHSIERANRFTGEKRFVLLNVTHRPMDIHVIHPLRQRQAPNPCGNNNGGCSHLCLIAPGGSSFSCSCPDFFILGPDRKTCMANCSIRQFRCGPSDDRCISILWKCDGENDCKDGSDEPSDCEERHCPPGRFQCANHNCTLPFKICDAVDDCGDNSDEADCGEHRCETWQFRCHNGKCIPLSWMCDLEDDCGDRSEELPINDQCSTRNCKQTEFLCGNGHCIPATWHCDLDDDCGDGTDEQPEVCRQQQCPPSWMRCRTNYRCIPKWKMCDEVNDCRDNSDELLENCTKCHLTDNFHCANGHCIPRRWRCDFDNDCGDNSDEDPDFCVSLYRQCSESEFRCLNHKCIAGRWRCDHDDDCGDGSDEEKCEYRGCQLDQFHCKSNHCVDKSFVCDGSKDCPDASDEANCTTRYPNGRFCPANKFQCGNSLCIPLNWQCDGVDDCGDESDETLQICQSTDCPRDKNFRCDNMKCIPRWRLCDEVDNCGDGSDENRHELCEPPRMPCVWGQFKCSSHKCINGSQLCNENDDCGDMSDEIGCGKGRGCGESNGGCSHTCTALSEGSYICHCPEGLKISSTDQKSCEDIDECAVWGNNCPQACRNVKGSFKCQCHDGFFELFSRSGRGLLCKAVDYRPLVLFAVGHEIRKFVPGIKDSEYDDVLTAGKRIQSLAVDVARNFIYWTDSSFKTIMRAIIAPKNGRHLAHPQDLHIGGIISPKGIAFDWVARILYWTDVGITLGGIYVTTDDGRYKKTLISGRNFQPMAIAVDPGLGMMFWTNVFPGFPKIESAWMTGANRAVLVSTNLRSPTGLAVDYYMSHRIFWCDSKENVIESMKPDGTDRVIVVKSGLNFPFSIDVFQDMIYWASVEKGFISAMDKFGRGSNQTLQTGLLRPNAVAILHSQKFNLSIKNPCANLKCWPLCLLTPAGGQCVCPDFSDFQIDSDRICNAPQEIAKPELQVCKCMNGGECLYSGEDDDNAQCKCFEGFHGDMCQYKSSMMSQSTVLISVLIPLLLLLIAAVAVAYLFYRRRQNKIPSQNISGFGPPGIKFPDKENQEPVVTIPSLEFEQDIDQQETLKQEYNPDGSDNLTDFSNPMYESFPDLAHPPALDAPTKISFTDLSTSSDLRSPSPANFSTSFQASADEKLASGFQPTIHDTGKDTQQLIESDAED